MAYHLHKHVRDDDRARAAFNALAGEVFGLSFEKWRRQGCWTDRYIPYLLLDGDEAAANVSVNRMETVWDGKRKQCIQLGTVMTAPAYRGRGLARMLMEEVLRDWLDRCDALYLFANDTVLDFYPKFGFQRQAETQRRLLPSLLPAAAPQPLRRLDMALPADRELLHACYQRGNPHTRLPMLDNEGLLMFYCASFLRDHIFYLEDSQTAAILEREEDALICLDLYGGRNTPAEALPHLLGSLLQSLPDHWTAGAKELRLGFTPAGDALGEAVPIGEDDALFIYAEKENPLSGWQGMFPLLSHA